MIDLELREKLIPRGHYLRPCKDGFQVARFIVDYDTDDYLFRSNEELMELHCDLPDALRCISESSIFHEGIIRCTQVIHMLQMLDAQLLVNDNHDTPIGFVSVRDVRITSDFVVVYGTGLEYEEHFDVVTSKTFRIPSGTEHISTLIKPNWLDLHFPGWEKRLQIALELQTSQLDIDSIITVAVYFIKRVCQSVVKIIKCYSVSTIQPDLMVISNCI